MGYSINKLNNYSPNFDFGYRYRGRLGSASPSRPRRHHTYDVQVMADYTTRRPEYVPDGESFGGCRV